MMAGLKYAMWCDAGAEFKANDERWPVANK